MRNDTLLDRVCLLVGFIFGSGGLVRTRHSGFRDPEAAVG